MTDQRLRELLHERAAAVAPVDLSGGAWERAVRARRRRALGVAAGAAAAVVAVAGVGAVVDQGRDAVPGPSTASPTPSTMSGTAPRAERSGTHDGAPVWWLPPTAAEAGLPTLEVTALPPTIDLSAEAPPVPTGKRAEALFQVEERAVVVADGATYSLDISRLEPVTDEAHNSITALSQESLSGDGRYAFFVQNRSLEVYDFVDGTWTTVDTPDWLAEGARWLMSDRIWVPDRLGSTSGGTAYDLEGNTSTETVSWPHPRWPDQDDQPYGPLGSARGAVAQAFFLAGPSAGTSDRPMSWGDAVVVTALDGGAAWVLAVPFEDDGRWKGCCPVVGWLDEETVLFQSGWTGARILAWQVGTPVVSRVADIRGWTPGEEWFVSSFGDLARD